MPSASDELRAAFPDGDTEALEVLRERFEWGPPHFGLIRPKVANCTPTEREEQAIEYMFHEWDYAYRPDFKAKCLR